ncbi:MAG: lipopolysaccharide transport periplasmic protein LptA [Nitrospirae bacterium]|nr:lipopolysaccharide transport periplasmic protein LptA [Nitrospirota bacterium]MBI5696212.1 lipopolysaccharide transport periplasmic protein LptA [Nitrospirota bacterium]
MCAIGAAGLCFGLCGPFSGVSLAGDKAAAKAGEPVVVTARTLTADNKKRVVIYKDGVVVKRGDITLHADNVTIRLAPAENKAGGASDIFNKGGGIETIEATGRVRILQGDRTATADKAVFYTAEDRIVMSGSPRVWEGGNVLTGSTVSYDLKEDTFTVEDAKTMLYPEQPERNAAEGKLR